MVSPVLIFDGSGDGILVISTDKQHLGGKDGCEIKGGMKIALGGCSFSEIGDRYFGLIFDPITIADSGGMRQLGGQGRTNSEHVEFGTSIVHGHLSALGRVLTVAHALIQHLVQRVASPHQRPLFSVLREYRILLLQAGRRPDHRSLLSVRSHVKTYLPLSLSHVKQRVGLFQLHHHLEYSDQF